jgi:hypothetical protein
MGTNELATVGLIYVPQYKDRDFPLVLGPFQFIHYPFLSS